MTAGQVIRYQSPHWWEVLANLCGGRDSPENRPILVNSTLSSLQIQISYLLWLWTALT